MPRTTTETIEIETDDGPMPAHLWRPPAGEGPGLVLVQEIFGVSDYIRARAGDLAELGYVVCAPELYWRLTGPDDQPADDQPGDEAADPLAAAMGRAQRTDWTTAVADVTATLSHLRGRLEVTGGVGLVGFCYGGGLAFQAAAEADPDALVSYYGSALPRLLGLADRVSAPSLHHFGLADTYIPPDQVAEIESALVRPGTRFETYAGAGHAFDNPAPAFFDAAASALAWDRTVRFLDEVLPPRRRS